MVSDSWRILEHQLFCHVRWRHVPRLHHEKHADQGRVLQSARLVCRENRDGHMSRYRLFQFGVWAKSTSSTAKDGSFRWLCLGLHGESSDQMTNRRRWCMLPQARPRWWTAPMTLAPSFLASSMVPLFIVSLGRLSVLALSTGKDDKEVSRLSERR